jgi:hypothetical protein
MPLSVETPMPVITKTRIFKMRVVAALDTSANRFCSRLKDIREITLQSLHDLLKPAKRDALVAVLKPMQR